LRATERLKQHVAQDPWLRTLRSLVYWATHGLVLVALFFLAVLLRCDDPSTVDDSMIPVALGALLLLDIPLVGLLLAGARPIPCGSALAALPVFLLMPWKDIHDAEPLAWGWMVAHLCILVASEIRRPTSRSSRRAAP
jgi:hypothetical protein